MIREGYAREYTYRTPYVYQAEFEAAEREAREQARGLWSPETCGGITVSPSPEPFVVVASVSGDTTNAGHGSERRGG